MKDPVAPHDALRTSRDPATGPVQPAAVRLRGVDVARGLAVLGMFGAHLLVTDDLVWVDPSTWTGLVDGRSSVLFALLAGVSVALLTGRTTPRTARRWSGPGWCC